MVYELVPVYFSVYILATTLILVVTILSGNLLDGSIRNKSLFCFVALIQIFVIPYLVLFIELFGSLSYMREASQAEPNYLATYRLFEYHVKAFLIAWIIGIALGLLFRYILVKTNGYSFDKKQVK
jgi:hypothetical protein